MEIPATEEEVAAARSSSLPIRGLLSVGQYLPTADLHIPGVAVEERSGLYPRLFLGQAAWMLGAEARRLVTVSTTAATAALAEFASIALTAIRFVPSNTTAFPRTG